MHNIFNSVFENVTDTEGGKWHTTEKCFGKLHSSILLEADCIHLVCALQVYKY